LVTGKFLVEISDSHEGLQAGRWRVPGFLHNPLTVAGLFIILLFFVVAMAAPWLAPYDPIDQVLSARLQPPSSLHMLGTDQLGRDILSRVIFGARASLGVGIVVVSSALTLGTIVGLFAGYTGGLVDDLLMRITDIFLAFPSLILAMAIAGALGPSLTNTMIAVAVVTWPVYARLMRAQAMLLREYDFVIAARSIGATVPRIMWRHIMPNGIAPLLVQGSFDMGSAILAAAGLSFIGFGAQPPTAEWGVMISEGRRYINTQPWLALFPGLAILLTVAAFNLLGDGMRDALDPRRRGNP
jgi:peptide/nickel transport system permease protein